MDAFKNLSGRVFGEQQPKNGEDKSKNKINPEKIEENKLLNNTASVVKNDQSFLDEYSL
jgi:hypothetical protein